MAIKIMVIALLAIASQSLACGSSEPLSQSTIVSESTGISEAEAIANVKSYLHTTGYKFSGLVVVKATLTPAVSRQCADGTRKVGCGGRDTTVNQTYDRVCIDALNKLAASWTAFQSEGRWVVTAFLDSAFWGKSELRWDFFPTTLVVLPHADQRC